MTKAVRRPGEGRYGHVRDMKGWPLTPPPGNGRIRQPEAKTGRDDIVKVWQDGNALGDGKERVCVRGWRQKKPLESVDSKGFPLCAEGDLNPHPLSRTSTSS